MKNKYGHKLLAKPTEPQLRILKQIHQNKFKVADNLSVWKQTNLLEKKKLIEDFNGTWRLTEKAKEYI